MEKATAAKFVQSGKPLFRYSKTILSLAMIALAGGVVLAVRNTQTNAPADPAASFPIPVITTHPVRRDVPIYRRGLGVVRAFNSVMLKARVDGTLDKVLFEEGQDVKAGDLLAEIDPRPYQAMLDQAVARKAQDEALLGNARRDLARNQALGKNQFVSKQTLDTQQANVAQLEAAVQADQAQIENAAVQLSYTRITAPIDGRLGLRQLDVGNMVHAADQIGLANISQVQPISVVFTLPADNFPAVMRAMKLGALPVTAFNRDENDQLDNGRLLTIDNMVDQATGTIHLKATFPNKDESLWPGLFVNTRLLLAVERNALTLDAVAVQRGPNGLFTFVVRPDATVTVQPVETIEVGGDLVIVSQGLTVDDEVVVGGQSRLQPGSRIVRTSAPIKGTNAGIGP
ncbi:MAG TPA: efflux RND transporter periplasmic adaptor subunit [Gemmataceae bacterium]|nr:efflux RND transporter periplasmic adaptor subunit [Gemmataceae bacterium]